MSMVNSVAIPVTTDSGGAATKYSKPINGVIVAVRYVPDGSTPLDTGADITVTAAASGLPILAATDIGTSATQWYPRAATCSTAGAAALYAGGGSAVNDRIPVADEAVKLVVAQGGNAKSGTFYVYYQGR